MTTVYVDNYYEVAGSTVKKYYYAGNQRVAMKSGTTVNWLLGDHLGSTAYTINGTTETGEVRYYAWGKDRAQGAPASGTTPTTYKFTGQREEASLGLYYYGARWYDPGLGRFIQPDTVVPNPGDTQSFDRYAYVNNNPLKYVDPTGHEPCPSGNWGDCRPQLGKLESNRLAQHYHDLGVSWTAVPGDAKAVLTAQGETEGSYSDLGPGATVQTGLKDPATVAAMAVGGGRLAMNLPRLLYQVMMGACAAGECTNEVEGATSSAQKAASNVQNASNTINWLEGQTQRVEHIMASKHEWGRLANLTGNLLDDYKAVQPFIQQTVDSGTRSVINQSPVGAIVEFSNIINNQQVVVRAVQTAQNAIQITDAWVMK
ncbi:MAG: RHS repeat-associated core domain-containing protein [Caldilineaceae bacterium]